MGRPERVGVVGGTFDPPHVAHVALAEAARDGLTLHRVLLVVAGDPWQKRPDVEASAEDRLVMVEAAVEGIDRLEASDLEIRRPGSTYTVDTLEALAREGRELFLVVGSDVAASIGTWHRPARIQELAVVAVAGRPGEPVPGLAAPWRVVRVPMAPIEVSSTDLRTRLREGRPVEGLIPEGAVRVIEERGLYTRRR